MNTPDAPVPSDNDEGAQAEPTVKVHFPTGSAARNGQDGQGQPDAAIPQGNPTDTPSPASAATPNHRMRTMLLSCAAAAVIGALAVAALSGGSGTHASASGDPTSGAAKAARGIGAGVSQDSPGSRAGDGASPPASSPDSSGTPSAHVTSGSPPATTGPAPTSGAAPTTAAGPAVPARAAAPAYAGRLASRATGSANTSPIPLSGGSSDGDALVLSVMLTNTHSGAVSARDSAGNTYTVVVDQSDLAGDRTLILVATNARALAAGGTVTLSFPATQEEHAALDAFSGVHTIAGSSSHEAAPPGDYASGYAPLPGTGGIAFEAAGLQGGSPAGWSGGVTALPTLVVAPADQLATAYLVAGGAGSYQAAGTCTHQWMAAVVTLS